MSWTPERESKLRTLWKKGHTASQIAVLIGDITRNAVIGKAHRLNLEARIASKKPLVTSKTKLENDIPTKQEKLSLRYCNGWFGTSNLYPFPRKICN